MHSRVTFLRAFTCRRRSGRFAPRTPFSGIATSRSCPWALGRGLSRTLSAKVGPATPTMPARVSSQFAFIQNWETVRIAYIHSEGQPEPVLTELTDRMIFTAPAPLALFAIATFAIHIQFIAPLSGSCGVIVRAGDDNAPHILGARTPTRVLCWLLGSVHLQTRFQRNYGNTLPKVSGWLGSAVQIGACSSTVVSFFLILTCLGLAERVGGATASPDFLDGITKAHTNTSSCACRHQHPSSPSVARSVCWSPWWERRTCKPSSALVDCCTFRHAWTLFIQTSLATHDFVLTGHSTCNQS